MFENVLIAAYAILSIVAICFYSDKCRMRREIESFKAQEKAEAARSRGFNAGLADAERHILRGKYDPDDDSLYAIAHKKAESEYQQDYIK